MRFPPALILILLIAGCGEARPPGAAQSPRLPPSTVVEVLIPIEVHKKDGEKETYTYGWVDPAALERLVAGPDFPKFIRLHDAYWFDDYGVIMLEDDDNSGTYYVRIDTLRDVSEMKPRSVDSIRAREKEADAKRKKAKEAKKAAKDAKDVLP